jgi:hypothetical protein
MNRQTSIQQSPCRPGPQAGGARGRRNRDLPAPEPSWVEPRAVTLVRSVKAPGLTRASAMRARLGKQRKPRGAENACRPVRRAMRAILVGRGASAVPVRQRAEPAAVGTGSFPCRNRPGSSAELARPLEAGRPRVSSAHLRCALARGSSENLLPRQHRFVSSRSRSCSELGHTRPICPPAPRGRAGQPRHDA